jgi:hypothetical protein
METQERLEALNPQHIKKAIDYELKHGYNRRVGEDVEIKKYKVTLVAHVDAYATAELNVEAFSEDAAEETARTMVKEKDFTFDDISPEIDLGDVEVEKIEKVTN